MTDRTERIARALYVAVETRWLTRKAAKYSFDHEDKNNENMIDIYRLAPLVERAIEAAANVRIDSAMAQDWAWGAALHALEGKP